MTVRRKADNTMVEEETPLGAKEVKTISLIDIARSGRFGPIARGSRLSDFANDVGPPDRWGDFSDKKQLSCLMVFGEVEVGFEAGEGDLLVTWAKITMWKFRRSYMEFGCNSRGEALRIYNPFGKVYPPIISSSRKSRRPA